MCTKFELWKAEKHHHKRQNKTLTVQGWNMMLLSEFCECWHILLMHIWIFLNFLFIFSLLFIVGCFAFVMVLLQSVCVHHPITLLQFLMFTFMSCLPCLVFSDLCALLRTLFVLFTVFVCCLCVCWIVCAIIFVVVFDCLSHIRLHCLLLYVVSGYLSSFVPLLSFACASMCCLFLHLNFFFYFSSIINHHLLWQSNWWSSQISVQQRSQRKKQFKHHMTTVTDRWCAWCAWWYIVQHCVRCLRL